MEQASGQLETKEGAREKVTETEIQPRSTGGNGLEKLRKEIDWQMVTGHSSAHQ